MSPYYFRTVLFFLVFLGKVGAQEVVEESQTLYPKKFTEKTDFYNFLWGKHYRNLYAIPLLASEPEKKSLNYIPLIDEFPYFRYYPEFVELYHKEHFEETYTERFIADAYTLVHPLATVITNGLAKKVQLNTTEHKIVFTDGKFQKLVDDSKNTISTQQVVGYLHEHSKYKIDQKAYVRSRILDMLIGNSLDVNQSYSWILSEKDKNEYVPYTVDRGFSFIKKDGLLFGFLLKSLGIKELNNYYSKRIKSEKINAHNLVYDLILAREITESVWLEQADFIKTQLTKNAIDEVFSQLPSEYHTAVEHTELRQMLLYRISNIDVLVKDYYGILQKIVVISGTAQDDVFKIKQDQNKVSITLINSHSQEIVLENHYSSEKTKEIWLYGLGGIDTFSVSASAKNNIVVRIINNDNFNDYDLEQAMDNVKIYTPESALVTKDEVGQAVLYKTDNPDILEYSQNRPKKHTLDFQPGLLFDTDLSVRFGGKLTYTRYAFKNVPFSARHELSWNHYYSLLYSGTFPTLSSKTAYTADVWMTSSNHFQNFFGFGNESQNYESSFGRDYNRVLLQKTGFDVGILFHFSENKRAIIKAGVERYNITDQQKFDRQDIFQQGELQNKNNVFMNIKGNYRILSKHNTASKFNYLFEPEVGLMLNFRDMNRNVPYLSGVLSLYYHPDYNRKYTIVSVVRAKALFNETYEFYQAAVMGGETGLRGFRNERFSGQQYFVHSNDFRIDIGRLSNKVMPLNLETFVGIDYGRVWYAHENSQKWHTSFGGGLSFKLINKFNTNISYFTSSERPRITLSLGYFF